MEGDRGAVWDISGYADPAYIQMVQGDLVIIENQLYVRNSKLAIPTFCALGEDLSVITVTEVL